ncbi:hypothetical protein PAEPH01_2179, partial [Pancytospora epiphaga]
PERILTDQSLEFKNSSVTALSSKYSFIHDLAYPDHYNTIKAAEGAIQTLFNKLLKLCNFNRSN